MMAVATPRSADSNSNPQFSQKYKSDTSNSDEDIVVFKHLLKESLDRLESNQDPNALQRVIHQMFHPVAEDSTPLQVNGHKLVFALNTFSKELHKVNRNGGSNAILNMLDFSQWCLISSQVTESYLQFFSILTSASPKWWSEIAKRIVMQMSEDAIDYTPHHTALEMILQLVPTASTSLSSILASGFPHKSSPGGGISNYVKNMLRVLDYAPEQLTPVWELVIQRVVEIDVECQDLQTEYLKGNSDLNDSSSESDSGSESESDSDDYNKNENRHDETMSDVIHDDTLNELHNDGTSRKRLSDGDIDLQAKRLRPDDIAEGEELTAIELEMADAESEPFSQKIDDLMVLLLDYVSAKFSPQRIEQRGGEVTELFNVLMHVFKKYVLPTSEPHAIQFLWFYVTHTHPDFMATFVSMLLETALMAKVDQEQKTRAMQYLASFVSRAKGMTRDQLVYVVEVISEWVNRYMHEHEREVDSAVSMAKFKTFYSTVQCLFYIFVFRHNELKREDYELQKGRWEAKLDKVLPQVVNTKFNPLQYCMPVVVAMFSRIAQENEVASCYSIIEQNRWGRFRTSAAAAAAAAAGGNRNYSQKGVFSYNRDYKLYDTYFPFQPLQLERTKVYIQPYYQVWSGTETDSESDFTSSRDSESELSDLDSQSDSDSELEYD